MTAFRGTPSEPLGRVPLSNEASVKSIPGGRLLYHRLLQAGQRPTPGLREQQQCDDHDAVGAEAEYGDGGGQTDLGGEEADQRREQRADATADIVTKSLTDTAHRCRV